MRARSRMALFFCTTFLFFSIADAEEIRYDKAHRRDPFIPLKGGIEVGGAGEWAIEGIVYDPKGGSYAVIHGEIYREGDEIEGSKVVRIFPDRVILLQESQEVVAWLREEVIAKKEGEA